jgi:hypothetical protein
MPATARDLPDAAAISESISALDIAEAAEAPKGRNWSRTAVEEVRGLTVANGNRDARRVVEERAGAFAQPAEEPEPPSDDPDEPATLIKPARFGEAI